MKINHLTYLVYKKLDSHHLRSQLSIRNYEEINEPPLFIFYS